MAPHSSFWDKMVLYLCTPGAAVMRAEERDRIIFGSITRFMQAIFVDRQSSESRHAVVKEIRRRATEPGWPRVLIFPEGTTTDGTALIHFQAGAFIPGRPVQPV